MIVLLIFAVTWYCSCCFLPDHFSLWMQTVSQSTLPTLPWHSKSRLVHLSLQLKREVFASKQRLHPAEELLFGVLSFFTRSLKGLWQVLSNSVGHPCLRRQMVPRTGKFIALCLEKLLFTQRFLHRMPAWFHWRKPEQGCVINELWQAFCLSGREVPATSF